MGGGEGKWEKEIGKGEEWKCQMCVRETPGKSAKVSGGIELQSWGKGRFVEEEAGL